MLLKPMLRRKKNYSEALPDFNYEKKFLNVKFFKVEELSTVKIGLTEESVHSPVAQISFECGTSAKTKKSCQWQRFYFAVLGLADYP